MYRWGAQADRRAQAAHLAAMARRPGAELRLLRFADGLHPGMISPVNIFDFPDDDDPAVVYLENDTTMKELPSPTTCMLTRRPSPVSATPLLPPPPPGPISIRSARPWSE